MQFCNANLEKSPLLYFTFLSIFQILESEYDDQAIRNDRYEKIRSSLTPLLIECIDNPTKPSLEKLIKEFWKLMK